MNGRVQQIIEEMHDERVSSRKWNAVFAVFALICMGSMKITQRSLDNADLLAGKATVEKFMRSNAVSMAVILLAFVGFVFLCFNTWKGRKGSMSQLLMTVGSGIIILYCGFARFAAIHNISKDLSGAKDVKLSVCTLCTRGANEFYACFDDGTDSVLLAVPEKVYDEIKACPVSENKTESDAYDLLVNDKYGGYKNIEQYSADVVISYYPNSVIYEKCRVNK